MNYQNIYNQIIERAQNRKLEGYKEKHHVIPKCMGGSNDKSNLVELTAREHFICHRLLCEIYPNNHKLLYALFLMTIGKQKTKNKHYIINSRLYERLKIEFSQMLTGKKHNAETRKKISNNTKGKKRSEEARKNMSEGRKGHKMYNDGWKLKIKEALTGIKRSDEFKQKQSKARKNKPSKSKKPVLQYDKQGNFLKEYPSATEAAISLNKKTGAAITEVCNSKGNRKSIFGYIWKYKN